MHTSPTSGGPREHDEGKRERGVAEMSCIPTENHQICGAEESAPGFKLPSAPCANQAAGASSYDFFQSVGVETVASFPNSGMADDQVLPLEALGYELPLQQASETEQQEVSLPALQQALMEDGAWNSDPSFVLLPSEMADQSMPVPPSSTNGAAFEAELRKGDKRPESGQPSQQHNAISLTETLRSGVEGTPSAAAAVKGVGLVGEGISATASRELQNPVATAGALVEGIGVRNNGSGGHFDKFVSQGGTQIIFAKSSGKPGSGGPSKGHN